MRFLHIFLLLPFYGSAQSDNISIKSSVNNTKTSRHINIPSTNVFIIPPAGYVASAKLMGFQKSGDHAITVRDSIGDNIYAYDFAEMKQTFAQLGAKTLEEKTVTVQQFPARYYLIQASPRTYSQLLIFGDSTFCTQVTTVYPASDHAAGQALLNAINTIYYAKQRATYPMDTSGFTLDENATRFKYFGFSARGNVYAFFVNGKEDNMKTGQPFVLMSRLPLTDMPSAEQISQLKELAASKYGMTEIIEKNVSSTPVNGYKTIQSEVSGKINGQQAIIYNCFITDGKKIFLFQGVSRLDLTNSLEEFKKLLRTISIK